MSAGQLLGVPLDQNGLVFFSRRKRGKDKVKSVKEVE